MIIFRTLKMETEHLGNYTFLIIKIDIISNNVSFKNERCFENCLFPLLQYLYNISKLYKLIGKKIIPN